MTDPTSSAVTGLAVATGAVQVTGVILGLQYDLLLPGMLGGLIALSFADPTTRTRMAISVFTSTIMAAYGAPVMAAVLPAFFAFFDRVNQATLDSACACCIGIAAQTLAPVVLGRWKSKIGATP